MTLIKTRSVNGLKSSGSLCCSSIVHQIFRDNLYQLFCPSLPIVAGSVLNASFCLFRGIVGYGFANCGDEGLMIVRNTGHLPKISDILGKIRRYDRFTSGQVLIYFERIDAPRQRNTKKWDDAAMAVSDVTG